ncbi:MAG: hypothetical protein HQK99_04440 [Nitrospirae bacterium]|nr:hypothetical protein [Nitrospirota bacterium]
MDRQGSVGSNLFIQSSPWWACLATLVRYTDFAKALFLLNHLLAFLLIVSGGYLFFKKVLDFNGYAIVVALIVYLFNTYILVLQNTHLLIYIAGSTTYMLLYLVYSNLNRKRILHLYGIVVFMTISAMADVRILYSIILFILLPFVILNISKNKYTTLVRFAFAGVIFVSFNLFWMLCIFNYDSANYSEFSRNFFNSGGQTLKYVLSLYYCFWPGNNASLAGGTLYEVPFYYVLIPLYAIAGIFLQSKKKCILCFALISIIGITLAKLDNPPFGEIYVYLWKYLPGFNVFRDSSKFYFIIAVGYSVLIGAFIDYMWKYFNKTTYQIFVTVAITLSISLLFLFNTVPLISGKIGGLFMERNIPEDYLKLKKFILAQPNYFRIMSIPSASRWLISTAEHPVVNYQIVARQPFWSPNCGTAPAKYRYRDFTGEVDIPIPVDCDNDSRQDIKIMLEIFTDKYAKEYYDMASIKYILIQIGRSSKADVDDVDADWFWRQFLPKDYFIRQFKNDANYEQIDIGTKNLIIIENKQYKPHIYLTNDSEDSSYKKVNYSPVDYKYIKSTEYKINLRNIKTPVFLHFSDQYNTMWKIRVGDFSWFNVLKDKNYFLPDIYHFSSRLNMNTFYIDPEFIKKEYKSNVKLNSDGSMDLDMTIYFRPQSYNYIGTIISVGAFLAVTLFVIIYELYIRRPSMLRRGV